MVKERILKPWKWGHMTKMQLVELNLVLFPLVAKQCLALSAVGAASSWCVKTIAKVVRCMTLFFNTWYQELCFLGLKYECFTIEVNLKNGVLL